MTLPYNSEAQMGIGVLGVSATVGFCCVCLVIFISPMWLDRCRLLLSLSGDKLCCVVLDKTTTCFYRSPASERDEEALQKARDGQGKCIMCVSVLKCHEADMIMCP